MSKRRGQTKRVQASVYEYLCENKEGKTADAIANWYNSIKQAKTYATRGYNHGVTSREIAGIMARSLLFEREDTVLPTLNVHVWKARPMEVVIEKAIASRSPTDKYPHFLKLKIEQRLGDLQ